MNDLPKSADRVRKAAEALGLAIEIVEMATPTRTVAEAAAACGCPEGAIVKSLIFKGHQTGRPYLLLVSGTNRVDEQMAAATLGETLARPDASYVRTVTGFAIGGVPPFGHATPVVPFMDTDLLQYETVWAAAGTPTAVFAIDPRTLRDATGATVLDMKLTGEPPATAP
jgi:prolyl-tRNA editing enzyme YbaK/EbsC (Cys-tRNA(Pro) deacylase)